MTENVLEKLTPKQAECVKEVWDRQNATPEKKAKTPLVFQAITGNLLSIVIIVGLALPVLCPNQFEWQDEFKNVAVVCLWIAVLLQLCITPFVLLVQFVMYLCLDGSRSNDPKKRKACMGAESFFLSRTMLKIRANLWNIRTFTVPLCITLLLSMNGHIFGAVVYFIVMVGLKVILRLCMFGFVNATLTEIEKRGITQELVKT
jgi:hypothetical protein